MSFGDQKRDTVTGGSHGEEKFRFGDHTEQNSGGNEVYMLAQEIVQEMEGLNTLVFKMKSLLENIGGRGDQRGLAAQFDILRRSTHEKVGITKGKILRLKAHRGPMSGEERTLKEKILRDWTEILDTYQKTLRELKDKQRSDVAMANEKKATARRKYAQEAASVDEDPGENTSLIEGDQDRGRQAMADLENEISFNEDIIKSREAALVEVESDINTINEMFIDLGMTVKEQGVGIESIETNIMSVVDNTDKGLKDLGKANKWQKRARTKVCLLFLVVIIALIALVIILAIVLEIVIPIAGYSWFNF